MGGLDCGRFPAGQNARLSAFQDVALPSHYEQGLPLGLLLPGSLLSTSVRLILLPVVAAHLDFLPPPSWQLWGGLLAAEPNQTFS